MTAFGWRAPWPRRFGGGAEQPVQVMLETMRAGRPDALTAQGEGSEVDAENRVAARMLAAGLRATARRVAQRDPRKLSDIARLVTLPDGTQRTLSPLARWERILGLVPARGASPRARRAAIYGALVAASSTRRSSVESAMSGVFGSWYLGLQEPDLADVHYPGRSPDGDVRAYWPITSSGPDAFHSATYPGEYSATVPWASWLAHITVLIQPPAATAQTEVDALVGKARQVLDDMLPAWVTFEVSQMAPESTESGFYLDISFLDFTAL